MQRLFLILTSGVYLLWVGWLCYVASTSADPITVSRPLVHVSPILAVADLAEPANQQVQASIKHVYRGEDHLPADASKLTIDWPEKVCGWQGPGTYLIALQRPLKTGEPFLLVPIPLSPGYIGMDRTTFHGRHGERANVFHVVYPWTESVRMQLEMVIGSPKK